MEDETPPSPASVDPRVAAAQDPVPRRSPRLDVRVGDVRVGGGLRGAPVAGGVALPAPGRGAAVNGRVGRGRAGRGGGRDGHAGRGSGEGRGRGRAEGRGRGRAGSGPRFTIAELEHLNESIQAVLPLGPEEWETVAVMHGEIYPNFNRCSMNLKRKFKEMYKSSMPTGDPNCPPHIRAAKRLHFQIQERSDADNLDGEEVDLAIDLMPDEDNSDNNNNGIDNNSNNNNNVEDNSNNNNNVEDTEAHPRRLFGATARPLVRTPVSTRAARYSSRSSDITDAVLASFQSIARSEAAEREERRLDRLDRERQGRMQTMMMMALISAVNPAAATAMQAMMQELQPNTGNPEANEEVNDRSSD